jgi:hypothetical protein
MKKLAFISAIVVTNIVLLITAVKEFNPNNLILSKLEYFNGFDYTSLFPSDGIGNLQIFGSIIGLVFINTIIVKKLK